MGWEKRLPIFLLILVVLTLVGGSVVRAEPSAELHMSTSPGGQAATEIQSGVARVYAVLSYEDMANTELKVSIFGAGGVVVFEQAENYSGSGQEDIEITGRDILVGYMAAAQSQSEDMTEAISLAQQASANYVKQSRMQPVIGAARSLKSILSVLQTYDSSLLTLDALEDVRGQADEIQTQATAIMSGDVSNDQMDSALDQLADLIDQTASDLDLALDEVDPERARPWLDGSYTTTLKQEGQIAEGFDWEINPEGVPGDSQPAASPTPTPTLEPTSTPTPTQTPEPSPTATTASTQSTAQPTPTFSPTRAAVPTRTPRSSGAQNPTATEAVAQFNPTTPASSPTDIQPSATPADEESTATTQTEQPAGPVETPVEEPAESTSEQTASSGVALPSPTPAAQALLSDQAESDDETAGVQAMAAASDVEPLNAMPLAPQEVAQLPMARIAAVFSALMLGLVALWLRAKV